MLTFQQFLETRGFIDPKRQYGIPKYFLDDNEQDNDNDEFWSQYSELGMNAEYPKATIGRGHGRVKNPPNVPEKLPRGFRYIPKQKIKDIIATKNLKAIEQAFHDVLKEIAESICDIYDVSRDENEDMMKLIDELPIMLHTHWQEKLQELQDASYEIYHTTDTSAAIVKPKLEKVRKSLEGVTEQYYVRALLNQLLIHVFP